MMRLVVPLTPWPMVNLVLLPVVWPLGVALAVIVGLVTGIAIAACFIVFLILAVLTSGRRRPSRRHN